MSNLHLIYVSYHANAIPEIAQTLLDIKCKVIAESDYFGLFQSKRSCSGICYTEWLIGTTKYDHKTILLEYPPLENTKVTSLTVYQFQLLYNSEIELDDCGMGTYEILKDSYDFHNELVPYPNENFHSGETTEELDSDTCDEDSVEISSDLEDY